MNSLSFMAALAFLVPGLVFAEEGRVLGTEGGRFVLGQISDFRRDQFMLDTATGRLWALVCVKVEGSGSGECKTSALSPVEYWDFSDIDSDFKTMPSQATSAPTAKAKK